MEKKERKKTHAEWEDIIKEQAQSGLSRKSFCQKKGLVLSQFSYYFVLLKKQKINKEHKFPEIIPIHLTNEVPSSLKQEVKIVLPNGLCLYLSYGESSQLKSLIEVLKTC